MKLVQVSFDDKEQPREFTVSMGLDEMALLYRLTGHISPKRITDLFGDVRWGNALYDLANGVGSCLNTFYDAGPDDVVPNVSPYLEDSAIHREGT